MSAVAAVMAGLAGALMLGGRLVVSARFAAWTPSSSSLRPRLLAVVLAAAAGTVLALKADGTTLVLGFVLLGAALGAGQLATLARLRRVAVLREERVLELCEALAGELRSGQPPSRALDHCADLWPEFGPVAASARLGADVPNAMRLLGKQTGAQGLRSVAGAWQVSESSGAALSGALTQVAESTRASQATRRIVASELASAQATARLVAFLPVFALAMGAGAGGDPWRFLLATPAGLTCLAIGLALIFLGLLWIERLASAVLR